MWDSGTLNQGQSYIYTFTTAGDFDYHCAIHPSMLGTVSVSAASVPSFGPLGISLLILTLVGATVWVYRRRQTA